MTTPMPTPGHSANAHPGGHDSKAHQGEHKPESPVGTARGGRLRGNVAVATSGVVTGFAGTWWVHGHTTIPVGVWTAMLIAGLVHVLVLYRQKVIRRG